MSLVLHHSKNDMEEGDTPYTPDLAVQITPGLPGGQPLLGDFDDGLPRGRGHKIFYAPHDLVSSAKVAGPESFHDKGCRR